MKDTNQFNKSFLTFHELLLSVLINSVVLGFFNDYTDIISTKSYSTTFFVALVLSLLLLPTFKLKKLLAKYFSSKGKKVLVFLSVWLVMFFSKFVFLWVFDKVFGDNLDISGFIGLIVIITTVTTISLSINAIYKKLLNKDIEII